MHLATSGTERGYRISDNIANPVPKEAKFIYARTRQATRVRESGKVSRTPQADKPNRERLHACLPERICDRTLRENLARAAPNKDIKISCASDTNPTIDQNAPRDVSTLHGKHTSSPRKPEKGDRTRTLQSSPNGDHETEHKLNPSAQIGTATIIALIIADRTQIHQKGDHWETPAPLQRPRASDVIGTNSEYLQKNICAFERSRNSPNGYSP